MREKNNNNFASAEQREALFLDMYKKAFHSVASYMEIIAARKIFAEAPKYRSFMLRITKLFTMA